MLNYLEKFKNTGTILSLVGLVGLLLIQFGVAVDMEWLKNTANIVCSILVILGICNNPETKGLDLPTNQTENK